MEAPIFLTAKYINGQKLAKPRVVAVNPETLKLTPQTRSGGVKAGLCKVKEILENEENVYHVFENPAEISAQILMNQGQATSLNAKNFVDLSIDAAGANAAAAADIVKTYTEIDTATAATTDGIQLPAATVGKVCVVFNTVPGAGGAGIALDVWPQTGENFLGKADDAQTTLAAKKRGHYVCETATVWTEADDFTQV